MQVELWERMLPIKLTPHPGQPLTDEEYFEFCMANPSVKFERTAEREIVIVPPAGGESDFRSLRSGTQLDLWAMRTRRGKAFGSSVEFILPDGAALSPDAAWVSNERLSKLTKEQLRRFLPVCPEFVIEVMSPSDRLTPAKQKMEAWMRNGVQLAWLIDADRQTVYVYRQGAPKPEIKKGAAKMRGEGPVAGLVMDMRDIWAGL